MRPEPSLKADTFRSALRLQLLEPDRYPFLLKALYGLLMLLPQSSAFATLRNRLSAVSSLGYLQTVPRQFASSSGSASSATTSSGIAGRSTLRRGDEIPWTQLVQHFRSVQKRRSALMASHALETNTNPSPGPSHEATLAAAASASPETSRTHAGTSLSSTTARRTRPSTGGGAPGGGGLGILAAAPGAPGRATHSARSSISTPLQRPTSPPGHMLPPTSAGSKKRVGSVPASTSSTRR